VFRLVEVDYVAEKGTAQIGNPRASSWGAGVVSEPVEPVGVMEIRTADLRRLAE